MANKSSKFKRKIVIYQIQIWYFMNINILLYFELILTTIMVVLFPSFGLRKSLLRQLPAPPPELKILLTEKF